MRSPSPFCRTLLVAIVCALFPVRAHPARAALASAEIPPDLAAVLGDATAGETVSVLVSLDAQVDVAALSRDLDRMHATRAYRHERIVRALRRKAESTRGGLIAALERGMASGAVASYRPFWIANVVQVEATRPFIERLAARRDVREIALDYEIEGIRPVSRGEGPGRGPGNIEEGLQRIHAPLAWGRGFTGAGRLVSHLDTGVDGHHVALASRWRGLHAPAAECWFDPVTNTDFPFDSGLHGTHTMGTICGYDAAADDHIGVAYDAEWISAGVIDRVDTPTTMSDALAAFEWVSDPDGDPGTVDDVPDVCSNSWGLSPILHGQFLPQGPCDPFFWSAIDNVEAAGVVVVWAAGNEGEDISPPNSIRNPANRAVGPFRSFCVGALDGANYWNDPAAWFSSRGPAPAECGAWTTKPEVAAPGVNVRSAIPGIGYMSLSGTSMATPHVAGAVAILRQADPNLTTEEIKYILMHSTQDLGPAGEDNTYGWGLIDLAAALDVVETNGCWWELTCAPGNAPIVIPEAGGSFAFDATLANHCDSTRTTDVWSMVRLPDGSRYGPVLLYREIPFGANQELGVTGMTHTLPGGAPAGRYRYTLYQGTYPSAPGDSCSFDVYKQGGGSGAPYRVLILLADTSPAEASAVINAAGADGRFLVADVMDAGSWIYPTLHDLLPYDVVQVWSMRTFGDATGLGDVLADYVDAGGAVVLSQFSFTAGWALGGRMMTAYSPLGVGTNYSGPVALGTFDPNHPIMRGVGSLTATDFAIDAPLQGNVDLVASWDNGDPCVVVNADVPRVVALDMYFGTSVFPLGGDWNTLVANALAFAGDHGVMRVVKWEDNDFTAGDTPEGTPAEN